MKTSILLGAALLFAAVVPHLTAHAQATDSKPPAASSSDSTARKSARSVPFRGKVAALDPQKMTFTLSGPKQRVFHLTSDTKIEKDGKTVTFSDVALGDEARGLYQSDDGQLVVIKASFGPKPETSGSAKTDAASKKEDAGS